MAPVVDRPEFLRQLEHEFSESIRTGRPLSLVMLAIVGFEHDDDRSTTASVLRQAIELVEPLVGEADLLSSCKDELLVLAPGLTRPEARQLATTIREAIQRHGFELRDRYNITATSV